MLSYSVWLGERLKSELIMSATKWESCLEYIRNNGKKSKTYYIYHGGRLEGIMKYKTKVWVCTVFSIFQHYDSHNTFYVKKDGTLGKPVY